jgi:hypothetical protein
MLPTTAFNEQRVIETPYRYNEHAELVVPSAHPKRAGCKAVWRCMPYFLTFINACFLLVSINIYHDSQEQRAPLVYSES